MDEQKLVQVFCRLCGFTNPSTNSSECPTCRTLEWRTDFLPSQQRIVDFQTQLLIPCRNQTFESVELECTNQTVFSLIKNQSVKEGENCKNCGQPWASSNELNLERIKDSLKPKGIDLPTLTLKNWFDYLNQEDRELVKKYNLYSVFKKGEPEFKFVPFFEYVFLDLEKNWNSPSWWLRTPSWWLNSIAFIIIVIILFFVGLLRSIK